MRASRRYSTASHFGVTPDLHPAVGTWFARAYAAPTEAQRFAWPEIAAGKDVLLVAPTGSGKTREWTR